MSFIKTLKMMGGAVTLVAALGMSTANAGGKSKSGFSMSGNVAINSQYILRGLTNTPEDSSAAISAGVEFSKGDTGLYFGYWGSSLGYSKPTANTADGVENDFYVGYKGKFGRVSYDVGLTTYAYLNVDDANTTELTASISSGAFSAGFALNIGDNVDWSAEGDLYYYIAAETKLPRGFKLSAKAGFYDYDTATSPAVLTDTGASFRHLDLTVSHALGKSGADMSLTLVIGGEDRAGVDQDDALVFGISYSF